MTESSGLNKDKKTPLRKKHLKTWQNLVHQGEFTTSPIKKKNNNRSLD